MRLTTLVALAVLLHPQLVRAQAGADSTRRADSTHRWTAQEISDACTHKPGARMRLYGCKPGSFIPRGGQPLFVVDGEALPTDTIGPGRLAREAKIGEFRAEDIESINVVKGDSAVMRFGPAARFGAVLIRTKRARP